jgi:predicted DCC family thiol-disulfide oxidoreductase YuxK
MNTASIFQTKATVIVYDGDCPFCRNYVSLMNLRAATGSVQLIDARVDPSVVSGFSERGFDLNEGMAVIHGGKIYFGEDAVVFISALTETKTALGKLIAAILKNKARADLIYPIMKFGRRVTLKALGISLIP